jgi:tetratricopeptide (TPR) repeat protein
VDDINLKSNILIHTDWLRQLSAWLILSVTILICFHSGTTGTFIFDDIQSIIDNESIQNSSLWTILKTKRDTAPAGRPLTNLSLAIDYKLYGLNPAPYIWSNIILQIIITCCLYATLRRLLPILLPDAHNNTATTHWLAIGISLLWATHPIQTECVLYITQRSLQYVMLGMTLGVYGLLRHHPSPQHHKRWLVLSASACIAAMLFKQNAVVIPLLLFLFDRAFLTGSFKSTLATRWRYHMVMNLGAIVMAIYVVIFNPAPSSIGTHLGVTRWEYLITQSQVIIYYLKNTFWPTQLCLYHDWPITTTFSSVAMDFSLISGLFISGLFCLYKRPKIGTAILSIFVLLATTSSVIPIVTEVAADRRMSLIMPSLLLIALVSVHNILSRVCNHKTASYALAAITLLLAISAMTIWTIPLSVAFGNPVVLWEHNIQQAKRPQSSWAQLGEVFYAQNQLAPAWKCYQNTLDIEPQYNIARLNMGMIYMKLDDMDRAIACFKQVENVPHINHIANMNLGLIYKKQKQYDIAITYARKAQEQSPQTPEHALNLARLYNLTGHPEQALSILKPFYNRINVTSDIHQEAGYTLSQLNQLDQAIEQYQWFLKDNPDSPKVINSLGVVYAKQGNLSQAIIHFSLALQLDPTLDEAKENLQRARGMVHSQ